jgi:hypothetical protein
VLFGSRMFKVWNDTAEFEFVEFPKPQANNNGTKDDENEGGDDSGALQSVPSSSEHRATGAEVERVASDPTAPGKDELSLTYSLPPCQSCLY